MRTFTWPTQVGSSKNVQFRVGRNEFGDGYTQLYTTGINPRKRQWSLTLIDDDYIKAVEQFFDDHKGIYPFLWTPPDRSEPVPVTCSGYATAYVGMDVAQGTFTFEEAHLPQTGV